MSMMSKINKLIVGGALCLGSLFLSVKEVSAYSSIFFDATLDTKNYQIIVETFEENLSGEYRKEDTYIREDVNSRVNEDFTMSKLWKNKFKPKSKTGPYEPSKEYVFEKWAKRQDDFIKDRVPASKKLTVPAMHLVSDDGKSVSELSLSSRQANVLKSAVYGVDRGTNTNLSMVNGLNQILSKIETLKGGYEDISDFRKTLMALGYLFDNEHEEKPQVVIGIKSKGEEIESYKNESDEENLDPLDEDYKGNGQDIKISMQDTGIVRRIIITQENGTKDPTVVFDKDMLIKADTGYKLYSQNSNKSKGITIKKDGVFYKNLNDLYKSVEGEDINFIHLKNIIAHALIKYECNAYTTTGEGSMGTFEKIIFNGIDGILNIVENALGLLGVEELIYNKSSYTDSTDLRSKYELGMYPKSWVQLIRIVYTFVAIVSVSILVFSVLRIFYRMTLDSMNIGRRIELKEDIVNILQTVLIMIIFVFLFKIVAYTNYMLVSMIYEGLGNGTIELMNTNDLGGSLIANVILRTVIVIVKVYLNVIYVIRGLNLALLLALSPAFVTIIAFGKKDIFAKYVQEIISNIFLQVFHAFIFLFIFEAQSYLAPGEGVEAFTSVFMSVVLTYAIIPTTKMFRILFMGSVLMAAGEEIGNKFGNKVKGDASKLRRSALKGAKKYGGKIIDQVKERKEKQQLEYDSDQIVNANANEELLNSILQNENGKQIFENLMNKGKFNHFEGSEYKLRNETEMVDYFSSMPKEARQNLKDYIDGISKLDDIENSIQAGHRVQDKRISSNKDVMKMAEGKIKLEERKKMNDTKIQNIRDSLNFGEDVVARAQKFSQMMNSADGVYLSDDLSNSYSNGYNVTSDFAKNMGFNEINTLQGEGENSFSNGFILKGSSDCIDNSEIPSANTFSETGEEFYNMRQGMEYIKKARADIRYYSNQLEGVTKEDTKNRYLSKIEDIKISTDKRLKECNVAQKGFLETCNKTGKLNYNKNAELTVRCVDNKMVDGGPFKGGVRIYHKDK